jgi:signal peptide peptidase SppA
MNMFSRMSGGTSYELLGAQLKQALADPKVQAILLDVDSPGGVADGVKTVADQILASRGEKPIVAFAHGQMCSAAYWIGASADRVMADDTAMVGSIGTLMTHTDRSAQDAQRGLKRTHIFAGRFKTAGSDAAPLSHEDQTYLQGIIDYLNQLFLAGVSQARSQALETVQQEMAEGRLFIGQQAKDAGLVDQIGTFDDALALARSMAPGTGQGGMRMDKATLESQHPELFAEVKALGLAEGAAEAEKMRIEAQQAGVQEERARVVEIFEAAGGQGLMLQVLKNGTGVKDTLKLMVANHEQMKAESRAAMHGAAPPVVGTEQPKVETHTDPAREAPLEERAKAEWDKDAKLQAEFGSKFENYLTYKRQEEAGNIKGIKKS